jgi:hypothetical protein
MRTSMLPAFALLALGAVAFGSEPAPPSLVGRAAPPLEGVRFGAGPEGAGLRPERHRGRVLVVCGFEDSDPGPQAGRTLLRELARAYGRDPGVALVALHATTAGRPPPADLPAEVPVGVAGPGATLGAYGREPLPCLVVVDREGVVRSHGPARGLADARVAVESVRALGAPANALIGQAFGATDALRGLPADADASGAPALTLYRWWTNACGHCSASLPALARLERRYGARGLRLVAVYHPKGRNLRDEDARAYAARLGVGGVVAFDDRWTKFRDLQARGSLRTATSISVLVDAQGVIRWVHPGPRIHESPDGRPAGPAADLAALDALLDRALPPAR